LIGIGLYSVSEAAAYTGIPSDRIGRWLFGYGAGEHRRTGLWEPELKTEDHQKVLSFHDLLEIRFVHAFRQHGVSLQAIRAAAAHAREFFNQPYPFTCQQFRTDGRVIFATVLEETGDESLIDLVKRQYVFKQVVGDSLYAGIDYATDGVALRWHPVQRSRRIVLDPARHFGKPILSQSGIDTESIALAVAAEGGHTRRVATLYEISVDDVEAAVQFERKEAA